MSYLDNSGLAYLWSKIKSYVDSAVSGVSGGVASSVEWANVQNKPANVSAFTNDSGYLTAHQDISGKSNATNLLNGSTAGSLRSVGSSTTIGQYAFAEGHNTTASGLSSHAEGYGTTASGERSHAEGISTTSSGQSSHSEGWLSTSSGKYSHAEGSYTKASSENQHVQGKFNIEDTNGIYAHIVGNGTDPNNRSNAHTLDWSGNGWYQGKVRQDGTPTAATDLTTKVYVDTSINIKNNRTTAVNFADTNYTISMARGISLQTTVPTSIPNGCIVGVYE